jgi:signal recognition particle GTPase
MPSNTFVIHDAIGSKACFDCKRKARIAGSEPKLQVNQLMKQFDQMSKMMKMMARRKTL